MKTSVWGNHAWEFLHACSMEYPENPTPEDKLAARALFRSLMRMLPCDDCCRHYSQEIRASPVEEHLASRETLVDWVLQLHNKVNARLGKPPVTKQQLLKKYENSGCNIDSVFVAGADQAVGAQPDGSWKAAAAIGAGVLLAGGVAYALYKSAKSNE